MRPSFWGSQLTAQGPLVVGPSTRHGFRSPAVRRASWKEGTVGAHGQRDWAQQVQRRREDGLHNRLPDEGPWPVSHLSWVDWPAGEGSGLLPPQHIWHEWPPGLATAPWSLFTEKSGYGYWSLLSQRRGRGRERDCFPEGDKGHPDQKEVEASQGDPQMPWGQQGPLPPSITWWDEVGTHLPSLRPGPYQQGAAIPGELCWLQDSGPSGWGQQ